MIDLESSLSKEEQLLHPEWVGKDRQVIKETQVTQQYQLDEDGNIIPYAIGVFV